MTRQLHSVSADAYAEIRDLIPSAIKDEHIYNGMDIADIKLSDAAILRACHNGIVIECGAKWVFLDADEFAEIIIR